MGEVGWGGYFSFVGSGVVVNEGVGVDSRRRGVWLVVGGGGVGGMWWTVLSCRTCERLRIGMMSFPVSRCCAPLISSTLVKGDGDDDDSASAASVVTVEDDDDDDDGDNYSDEGGESGSGSESESESESEVDDEQPLNPAKILARKTLKPAEWRELCRGMNTDQVKADE